MHKCDISSLYWTTVMRAFYVLRKIFLIFLKNYLIVFLISGLGYENRSYSCKDSPTGAPWLVHGAEGGS